MISSFTALQLHGDVVLMCVVLVRVDQLQQLDYLNFSVTAGLKDLLPTKTQAVACYFQRPVVTNGGLEVDKHKLCSIK